MDSVFCPELINLHFYFNLEAYSFESKADVTGKLTKDTDEIHVNAKRLQFKNIFYQAGDCIVNAENYFYDEDREMVIFRFPETLKSGAGQLVMFYTSELNEQFRGLYYINFDRHQMERDRKLDKMRMRLMWEKGINMETESEMEREMERMEEMYQAMIVGNFDWCECMRAFPCWFNLKITYNLVIECNQELQILSNMLEKKNRKRIQFDPYETQNPMKIAIVLGNFQTAETKGESLLRFHCCMDDKQFLNYAKECAKLLMSRLKSPWPIKIDFVEVPDLSQEYCINPGLVMFRYTHLMASRDSSTKVRWQIKRAVAETMAAQYMYSSEKIENEYLWTVFGYFLMDHGMDMLKIFYTDIIASAMDDDMPQTVESFQDDMYHKQKEEIEVKKNKQYNDSRKWNKIDDRKRAAAVLAKWWMESESKEKLRKMSTNTDPSFWQGLLKKVISYENYKEMPGFPILKVAWVRDGDQLHMKFHQDFYYDLENTGQSRQYFESGWPLNLKIYRRNQPEVNFFMQNFSREMTFNNFSDQDWIFINGMDLFRTEYSEEMLQQLIKGVRDQTLPPMCRMKLQNDLFALTRDSRMSLHLLIKCLLDFSHETDFCIWYDMVRNFDSLHQLLQNKQRDEIWAKFAVPFFHNIWMIVGWEKKQDEQPMITMLRGELIAVMGRIGDQEIVSEARRRFKYFMNHREYLDPNIRYGVYVTVLAHENGRETFDQLIKMYEDINWREEKNRIEEALGSVKRRNLLKEVARLCMSRTVYKQDCARILRGMTHTVQGRDVAWQFYKNHWDWFDLHFRNTPMEMEIIQLLIHKFATDDMLEDVKMFFKTRLPSCGYNFLQRYYWRIKWYVKWKDTEIQETMAMVDSKMKPNK